MHDDDDDVQMDHHQSHKCEFSWKFSVDSAFFDSEGLFFLIDPNLQRRWISWTFKPLIKPPGNYMPISPTLPDYKVITETCACQPARGQGTETHSLFHLPMKWKSLLNLGTYLNNKPYIFQHTTHIPAICSDLKYGYRSNRRKTFADQIDCLRETISI